MTDSDHPCSPLLELLARVDAAAWTLKALVPGFWWGDPPNQATKDVLQGIDRLIEVLGPPSERRALTGRGMTQDNPCSPRCCHTADGLSYCGQPECDIYYCTDCGDEFYEPCQRHVGVTHEID